MRIAIAALCLALCAGSVSAQTTPSQKSPDSTGRTVLPPEMKDEKHPDGCAERRTASGEMKSAEQPQGCTGQLQTGAGGSSATSPQGETPPAMQAAPQDSSKTIADPK